MSSENGQLKISKITILIGLVGLIVSLYALVLHIQLLMLPGHGSFCDVNFKVSCSSVIGSSYGEFASIPLGAYGMSYFIIILAAAILPKIAIVTKKQLAFLEMIIGLVGLISVVGLFYISKFILGKICPTCTVIHVVTLLYFIIKVSDFIKFRKENLAGNSEYFVRFVAVVICLAIPPLAAGLIAPIVIEKYFPIEKKDTPKLGDDNSLTNAIFSKEEFLKINKSNYVGNGEDYRRGSDDAKVVVQVFSDFGCPHCRQLEEPLKIAQDKLGLDKVLVVFRFFPLAHKCNPYVPGDGWYAYSCILPQASRCAGLQGQFLAFKDWAFAGQDWSDAERQERFSMAGLKSEAKLLGLHDDSFEQCLESGSQLNKIKEDAGIADKLKIKGTPLILINGNEYEGAHTVNNLMDAFSSAQVN